MTNRGMLPGPFIRRLAGTSALAGALSLGSALGPQPASVATTAGCPSFPAGDTVTVRLLEPIDSEVSTPGDLFKAKLEEPLRNAEDGILAPSGAQAGLRLVRLLQPKDSNRPPVLALQLAHIEVSGQSCPVLTGFAEVATGVRKLRSAGQLEGTTSTEVILDALSPEHEAAIGGPAAVATVRGAGVSFQVVSGEKIKAAENVVVRFQLAQPLKLGPRTVL